MKKSIFFIIISSFSILSVKAQNDFRSDNQDNGTKKNSGIVISLGAEANYYYGPGSRNFDKYENDRLNWQIDGMLGLTIARRQKWPQNNACGFWQFWNE